MRLQIARTALKLALGSLMCAVLTWGQASLPAAQAAAKAEPKAAIEGRVVNGVNGEPLRKVTLTLVPSSGLMTITADSDDNGHFVFQNLQPGRYQLIGERNGFARQAYGSRSNAMTGTSLVISSAGQEIKDLVFKLVPASVIAGRTLDEEGEPIGNVIVLALRTGYTRGKRDYVPLATVQTNDMGEFRLSGLKAGSYIVAASYRNIASAVSAAGSKPRGDKPELAYTTTYFPNSTDPAYAGAVEVGIGAEVRGTDIQMVKVPTFRVKGKVAEMQEGKTMRLLVTLTPRGAGVIGLITRPMTMVQPDGSFEFRGVPAGSYLLGAMGVDMASSSLIQAIEVGDQHVENVALQVATGGDLPVNVNVEGKSPVDLKSVRIMLTPSDMAGLPKTAVFDDGKFTVKSMVPGRYELRVSNLPENLYLKSARMGMADVDDTVDLTAGVRGALQIVFSSGGAQVDGAVRGEDGNPLAGAVVTLIPSTKRYSLYKETTTDQAGAFSFKGVTPGEYKLLAWEDIDTGAYQDPEFVKPFEGDAQSISLRENDRKVLSVKAIPFEKSSKPRGQ